MIPKVIHYCWFGRGKLPSLAQKCIASWKRFFPDYEIKEWNEDNFDVHQIDYTSEAYKAKKYAFVSDYARFKILYDHGGLYFDTDVEVLRPMDEILKRGAFMGLEEDLPPNFNITTGINPGLGLACAPGLGLYKEILDLYGTLHFEVSPGQYNLKTVVQYTSEVLRNHEISIGGDGIMKVAGVLIYPTEYFCPKSFRGGHPNITSNTYTIHHYSDSWHTPYEKFKMACARLLGHRLTRLIVRIKHEGLFGKS